MSKLGFLFIGGARIPLRARFEYRGRMFAAARVDDASGPVMQLRCITDYQEALNRAENAAAAVEIAQRRDIEMLEAERTALAARIGRDDADSKDADVLDSIRAINLLIENHMRQIKDAVTTINATTYITELRPGVAYTPVSGWFAQDAIWCCERVEMGSVLVDVMPVSSAPYVKQQELLIYGTAQWWKFNGRGYSRMRGAAWSCSGAAVCINGSVVYDIGGYAKDDSFPTSAVAAWDLIMNTDADCCNCMPYGRAFAAIAKWRGKFIISGGLDEGGKSTRTVLSTRDMSTFTSMPLLDHKRHEHTMLVCNDHLYVIGGADDDGDVQSIEVYDTDDEEWNEIKSAPLSLGSVGAVARNESIYIFDDDDKSLKYNTLTREWSTIAVFPRTYCSPTSAHVMGAYAYVLASVPYRYCFDTDIWESLDTPPFEWHKNMRVTSM